jgi:hypothetical protein
MAEISAYWKHCRATEKACDLVPGSWKAWYHVCSLLRGGRGGGGAGKGQRGAGKEGSGEEGGLSINLKGTVAPD